MEAATSDETPDLLIRPYISGMAVAQHPLDEDSQNAISEVIEVFPPRLDVENSGASRKRTLRTGYLRIPSRRRARLMVISAVFGCLVVTVGQLLQSEPQKNRDQSSVWPSGGLTNRLTSQPSESPTLQSPQSPVPPSAAGAPRTGSTGASGEPSVTKEPPSGPSKTASPNEGIVHAPTPAVDPWPTQRKIPARYDGKTGKVDISSGGTRDYTVDFGNEPLSRIAMRISFHSPAGASALVLIHADSATSPPIGSFSVGNSGTATEWQTVHGTIEPLHGVHKIYFSFVLDADPPVFYFSSFSFS